MYIYIYLELTSRTVSTPMHKSTVDVQVISTAMEAPAVSNVRHPTPKVEYISI